MYTYICIYIYMYIYMYIYIHIHTCYVHNKYRRYQKMADFHCQV